VSKFENDSNEGVCPAIMSFGCCVGGETSLISLENANRGSLFLFFMFVRKNDTDEKWIPFVNVKCFGVFRKMKM
jgi:hypothetical protein